MLKLKSLNHLRLLQGRAAALEDHKCLIMAIGSGRVENLDCLVQISLKRGLGVRGMIELYNAAADGTYHPKSLEERDYLRGILYMRIGGNRMAEIAHRVNGLPALTTLRTNSTMPSIVPSPSYLTSLELSFNIDAVLQLKDLWSSREESSDSKICHQVLMLDEIALEKRAQWDTRTNLFISVCREHGHKASLEFNSINDLDELFKSFDSGVIHQVSEATVSALGILTNNKRIYNDHPILVSGTCKRENGQEHADLIQMALSTIDSKKSSTHLCVVSIVSDGKAKQGWSLVILTLKHKLSPQSNVYSLLKPLTFMNFLVGDDDITCDKDYKHIFKHIQNLLLRARGFTVLNVHITPSILQSHLHAAGHSDTHIRSLFKPDDKQDMPLTYSLLRDIWSLPLISDSSAWLRFTAAREAIYIMGRVFYHLVMPYTCVDLTLSEQPQHLSAAAHLTLVLYRQSGKDFLPTLLYTDIGIMVKNAFFCVAKAKVDDPLGKFWIILLGRDHLEQLFGILHSIVGNDANVDLLQLVIRLTGTTEVANILAYHPEWDCTPHQLRLPAVGCDEISDSRIDHINPSSWQGDVSLSAVLLQTLWNIGRSMIKDEVPQIQDELEAIEAEPVSGIIDIFRPLGILLFNIPLEDDDNEEEDTEDANGPSNVSSASSLGTGIQDLEDAVASEEPEPGPGGQTFDKAIVMDGKKVHKV
ncbi:hypothetical protein EV421DRAFT_1907203 [Armillaria borealis]|uniref:Uncharacterized protein n=1 Tax=Armillaria borealis TaxID=47425 RepID=A0AA39J7Q9_9AGAR|nr:hypothetical protein EV421DRAFT_1907203 [Armillaria borealis]